MAKWFHNLPDLPQRGANDFYEPGFPFFFESLFSQTEKKSFPFPFFYFFSSTGYDPNGDYIYTKGQHYGAEEWILKADEQSTDGRRAVVLFANFGKKYLAIRNGELTGVAGYSEDCVWILD